MLRWGEATLGKTMALLVSAKTKIPGVVSVAGSPPIWTLALSKSVIEFCKVNPSTELKGSTVVPVASLERSLQPVVYLVVP